jgi:hypothetical protein
MQQPCDAGILPASSAASEPLALSELVPREESVPAAVPEFTYRQALMDAMDAAEMQDPPKIEICFKNSDLPARVCCIGEGAEPGPTRCGKRACPYCLFISATASQQEQYQCDICHAIVNFVKIATPMQKDNKWHSEQEHGVAGIFLSLAKNLKDTASLRKDLSYYGALRLDKPHVLEKCKSGNAPQLRVGQSGGSWRSLVSSKC